MIDEQIKNNIPQCAKCSIKWSKITPLIYWHNFAICGNCLIKVQEKEKAQQQKWLEES